MGVYVEWNCQVVQLFAFVEFKKNQKLVLQLVARYYFAAVLLTNCHPCINGDETSKAFKVDPPTLNRLSVIRLLSWVARVPEATMQKWQSFSRPVQIAFISESLSKMPENAVVCGDGRCDSPGHCGKLLVYPIMDHSTRQSFGWSFVTNGRYKNAIFLNKKNQIEYSLFYF